MIPMFRKRNIYIYLFFAVAMICALIWHASTVGDDPARYKTTANLCRLGNALGEYYALSNSLPVHLSALDACSELRTFFLKDDIPSLDGWGYPFIYEVHSDLFELRSVGADGKCNTGDDIIYSRLVVEGDSIRMTLE